MLRIELSFDEKTYGNTVASFDADSSTGLVNAVNAAAEAPRNAVRAEMLAVSDRPPPYTMQGVALHEATPRSDGGASSALVFLLDDQAAYLDQEVVDGPRTAGDYATTRLGSLASGLAAPRDGFGGLPRGFVASALADPAVSWVTLKPGEPPTLVCKVKGQLLEVLALIATETHYGPWLDFYGAVERAVQDAPPGAVVRVFARASGVEQGDSGSVGRCWGSPARSPGSCRSEAATPAGPIRLISPTSC